jgi:hypothetical protein
MPGNYRAKSTGGEAETGWGQWVRREAQRIEQWTAVGDDYAVGEFQLRLHNWNIAQRFVVTRKCVREKRNSVGRKVIGVLGYTSRIFVTSSTAAPLEIWREYRNTGLNLPCSGMKQPLTGPGGVCAGAS